MRRAALALLAAAALGAALAPVTARAAGAVVAGSGELDGGRLSVGIDEQTAGAVVPVDASSPALPRLVHYVATLLPVTGVGNIANLCNAGRDPGTGAIVFGWLYEIVGYARDGTIVSVTHECVPLPDPNDPTAPPPPPALPSAPTVGDVWRAVALPRPVVGVNPVRRGVTGLATWLWSGGPTAVRVAVALDGWTVTGVARVVGYRFATDEGALAASATPGDAAHPAATHVFATKGTRVLMVSSVWQATVTMTGPGVAAPLPVDIERAVVTAAVDYPVTEVRAVLVG